MNKKLLAMLFVVALAPMSQGFAADKKPGFLKKVGRTLGLAKCEDGNVKWGNTICYTGGGLLAIGSGIYLGVRAYQDPEGTGDAFKAFWTFDGEGVEAAMEQNADVIYANIALAAGGALVAGGLVWDGVKWAFFSKDKKALKKEQTKCFKSLLKKFNAKKTVLGLGDADKTLAELGLDSDELVSGKGKFAEWVTTKRAEIVATGRNEDAKKKIGAAFDKIVKKDIKKAVKTRSKAIRALSKKDEDDDEDDD